MARKLKGLVAAVFAVLFAVALAPRAAFALEANGSLTVSNLKAGDKVSLYTAAYTGFDENPTYGSEVQGTGNDLVKSWYGFSLTGDDGKLITVEDYENGDDATKSSIANKVAPLVKDGDRSPAGTATSEGESVTFTGLYPGLYCVKVDNNNDASVVYQNTLIPVNLKAENGAWVYDEPETVELKKSEVSITKKVCNWEELDDGSWNGAFADSASFGTDENVDYELTVVVPQYSDATGRTFTVTDVLPAGIEYVDSSQERYTVPAATVAGEEYVPEVSVENGTQVLTFDLSGLLSTYAGQTVTIDYTAYFAGTTLVKGGRVNTATLTFSASSEGVATKTVSDTATVNSGALKVILQDEDGNKISGAKFELGIRPDDSDATAPAQFTATTDENGELVFDGTVSPAMSWTINQIWTPAGYGLTGTTTCDIEATNDYTVVTITASKVSGWLPSTGGAGTFGITLLGVLVVAGVAALHVGSRKRD